MKSLSLKCYHALSQYEIYSQYRLTAISKAAGILRNYRGALRKNPQANIPYVRKASLVDCYGFRVQGKRLRITLRAHEYAYIDLNQHTLEVIAGHTLRSIALTNQNLSIVYSKEVEEVEPEGLIGIDRNLDNATIASSDGSVEVFDTSRITQMKDRYSEVKSHFKRNDHRIMKQIYSKYGKKQTEVENQELHKISKEIIEKAKSLNFGIVMENIKGIRKLYRKGNGQGNKFRRRLNSWSFYKLQKMIEYKARWEGLKVIYVPPHKTSSSCATCGSKVVECAERKVWCPKCKAFMDRDVNAARNILARGLRFKPIGLPDEAMKGNETPTPILLVDGSQLISEVRA